MSGNMAPMSRAGYSFPLQEVAPSELLLLNILLHQPGWDKARSLFRFYTSDTSLVSLVLMGIKNTNPGYEKAPVYMDFIESIFVPSNKQNWVLCSCKKMTFDHYLAFLCTFDKLQMQ